MKRLNLSKLFLELAVGLVFLLFNYDGLLRYAAHHWTADRIATVLLYAASVPDGILDALNPSRLALLQGALNLCFYGLWVYLFLIVVLSVAKMDVSITGAGVGGFLTGAFSLNIIAWIVVLFIGFMSVLALVFGFVKMILTAVFGFVVMVLSFVWSLIGPIIRFLLPIIGVLLAIAVAGLLIWGLLLLLRELGFKGVFTMVVIAAVVYFAAPLFKWIYQNFILPVLAAIVGFLKVVLGWIFKAVLVLAMFVSALGAFVLVVGSAGRLVIDQFHSAWHGGTGKRGILLGSFSIGLALAMIMLVSSGSSELEQRVDQSWKETALIGGGVSPMHTFDGLMPSVISESAKRVFDRASAPDFDAIVLLMIFPLSYIGLFRGLRSEEEDIFQASFVSQDVLKLGGAMALALPLVAFAAIAALAPRDN